MPTSVHLPKPLLDKLDRRAKTLRISRNQLVVRALERELSNPHDWAPEFLERLGKPEAGVAEGVEELLGAVRKARRSKEPKEL